MSASKIPEPLIAEVDANDAKMSGLLRIELRCAAAWAEAYAVESSRPRLITSSAEGEAASDERDWRRAWIQVRGLRFGQKTIFNYEGRRR